MTYWAAGGDTVITATNDYELLGTYAVRRTNGSLTMLVINKSSYASLSTAINLAGYVPFSNATVYSYGIPQDNAARTGIGSMDVAQTNSRSPARIQCIFAPYSATVLALTPAAPSLAVPASPPPPPGQFIFELQGLSGVPYVIQMSTNLTCSKLDSDFHQHAGHRHALPHQCHVVRRTVLSRRLASVNAAEMGETTERRTPIRRKSGAF